MTMATEICEHESNMSKWGSLPVKTYSMHLLIGSMLMVMEGGRTAYPFSPAANSRLGLRHTCRSNPQHALFDHSIYFINHNATAMAIFGYILYNYESSNSNPAFMAKLSPTRPTFMAVIDLWSCNYDRLGLRQEHYGDDNFVKNNY